MRLALFALVLSTLISCGPKPPQGPGEDAIRAHNVGVGLMGRFQYKEAAEVFRAALDKDPNWTQARVNLGIATLNLQTPGSEDEALADFAKVLESEPDNPQALFCSALLYVYRGDDASALPFFEKAWQQDPNDPHLAYYLGQCRARAGDHEGALEYYEKAAAIDPYLRSAWYGMFQSHQRLKDRARAKEALATFQKLKDNPQARQVEFKYTRMGHKAEVWPVYADVAPKPKPEGPVFAAPTNLPLPTGKTYNPGTGGIAMADLDGDGLTDLVVAAAWRTDDTVFNGVYRATQKGFQAWDDHPLVPIGQLNAVLFGDFDNDGQLDLYLCRKGPNQIWYGTGEGSYEVRTDDNTANGTLDTRDGTVLDADHDGDLDLFLVNADGPNELLNNNLDGTWRPLAQEQKMTGKGDGKHVLAADFDNDRDLDLLVLNQKPPHEAYRNELLWRYEAFPGLEQLLSKPIEAAVTGDANADGILEIYAISNDGLEMWYRDEQGSWQATVLDEKVAPEGLAYVDVDGSGQQLPLALTPTALTAYRPTLPGMRPDQPTQANYPLEGDAEIQSWVPYVSGAARGPEIVARDMKGALHMFPAGRGRHPFLNIRFSGATSEDLSTRSNHSGLGARFAIRNGSTWTAGTALSNRGGAGSDLMPLAVGLGPGQAIDYVALTWPDGVFQTELHLTADKPHLITETQRQLASCPVLFAWDGEEYRFISDVLGVGGIGFNLGRGTYATPRPWEHFMLPWAPVERDGRYLLKIAEPMEESAYLDHAVLDVWDLPEGWSMTLDERMGTGEPEPSGRPVFYRQEHLAVKATNERGETVTQTILEADGHAAPPGTLDHRFLGLLQGEHALTLTFDQLAQMKQPWLMIDGWLEYPYSQTCFAAWQAGKSYDPPTLEVQRSDGVWQTLLPAFGYPAGMPRRMAVPLPKLPEGAKALRLTTNQEIYWDRIALIEEEACPEAIRNQLPLLEATLSIEGFAKRSTLSQRRPAYDDTQRQPLWDTRHQTGYYTRTGDVTELLESRDDALCIIGPGEAVTFAFALPPGKTGAGHRAMVLRTAGWCKDMDLYTQNGETLEPLPETGKPTAPKKELHAKYNTRYQAGH